MRGKRLLFHEMAPPQTCDARRSSQPASRRASRSSVRSRAGLEIQDSGRPQPTGRRGGPWEDRGRGQGGQGIGPYTEQEVHAILGKLWARARRVGLVQSSGTRPIDDFSEFGHNGTSETQEGVDLATVGVKGDEREGRFHASFKEQAASKIKGRTVGGLPSSWRRLRQWLLGRDRPWHPRHGEVRHHMLRSLPFGARNAVFTFGGACQSLGAHRCRLFYVVMMQYVEDFSQLEALVDGLDILVEVLELLGGQIKKEKGEAPKFAEEFTMLGVGTVRVSNKPERGQRIRQEVEQIIRSGMVCPAAIEALRGSLKLFTWLSASGGAGGSIAPSTCVWRSAGAPPCWTRRPPSTSGSGRGTSPTHGRERCRTAAGADLHGRCGGGRCRRGRRHVARVGDQQPNSSAVLRVTPSRREGRGVPGRYRHGLVGEQVERQEGSHLRRQQYGQRLLVLGH